MAPTVVAAGRTGGAAGSGPTAGDRVRAVQLRAMKRRATGLLIVVTAVFVVLAAQPDDPTWVGYALAAAEGSMVGGLADWFAVTALFRHPLGLPIPHTAVIRQRKDQFGETLGAFVQDNFLRRDIVAERIRAGRVPERVAAWMSQPSNADIIARWGLEAVVAVVELVGDDDLHRLLHDESERMVQAIPLAQLAGRALRVGVEEDRHHAIVEAAIRGAITFLDEQREPLRERFGQASPWWLPGALEHRLFDRVLDGARLYLTSVAGDPDHEFRASLDARLRSLAHTLEHDPAAAARAGQMVGELLAHPELRAWTRGLWDDLSTWLRSELAEGASGLLGRVSEAVVATGQRLGRDTDLQERLARAAESAAGYVIENHRGELSSLITATVSRWDAEETSTKLELLLGRDLQFIRMNGTAVGGLAGLAIHGVAAALG